MLTGVIGIDSPADSDRAMISPPADTATGVPVNQAVAATFSEAMNPATLTRSSFILTKGHGGKSVSGTVTSFGSTATFTPNVAFETNTTYTATITTRAKDVAGNPLPSNFAWSFAAGPAPDNTAPTVSLRRALRFGHGCAGQPDHRCHLQRGDERGDDHGGNFYADQRGHQPGDGVPSPMTRSATPPPFAPGSPLAPNANYAVTITTGAEDLAGNAFASDVVWTFTTAATTAGQALVAVGANANFAVLAGATVTSVGATTLNGDLGVSPGSAITGFPPGLVNGTIRIGDSAAAQAQLDLTVAYNDAAGRTVGVVTSREILAGSPLTPGLYRSTSSLEISSGDLTLDAQGDANAVFISKSRPR